MFIISIFLGWIGVRFGVNVRVRTRGSVRTGVSFMGMAFFRVRVRVSVRFSIRVCVRVRVRARATAMVWVGL
jgi:hypothetical protein